MKKVLLLIILAGFGVLGYNIYSWQVRHIPRIAQNTNSTFTVDTKANIVRAQRIGLNWEDKSFEHIKPLRPGYLRAKVNPDNAAEFIAFSKSLNTTPWMVISSDLGNEDYYSLGHFLKDEKFNHIIVEIDNQSPEKVENAFHYLIDGSGNEIHLQKILNAPDISVDQLLTTLETVPSADYVLVQTNDNLKQMADKIRSFGKKLAVADKQANGALLGKQWIQQISMKIQPQVVSIQNPEDSNALALKMINKAILGSAHRIHNYHSNIGGVAFKTTSKWTAAFYNDSDKEEEIEVQFPQDNRLVPHVVLTLTSENGAQIKKTFTSCCKERLVKLTLPAHSFAVLPPQSTLAEANITTEDG